MKNKIETMCVKNEMNQEEEKEELLKRTVNEERKTVEVKTIT